MKWKLFSRPVRKLKQFFQGVLVNLTFFSQGLLGRGAGKNRKSLVFLWGLKRVKNFNLQRSDAESAPGAKKCLVRNLTIMIIGKEDQNILF